MRNRCGWTLVEWIVVVALLGLVAAIAATAWTGSRAHADAAAALARRIASVRWQAVLAGRAAPCLSDDAFAGRGGDVRIGWPRRGLSFTADGLPRTCDGGGVGNATILVEHREGRAAVVVSSLGRVRWELR